MRHDLLDRRQFACIHGANERRLTAVCTVNDDVRDADAFLQPLLLLLLFRLLTCFQLSSISNRLQTASDPSAPAFIASPATLTQ